MEQGVLGIIPRWGQMSVLEGYRSQSRFLQQSEARSGRMRTGPG